MSTAGTRLPTSMLRDLGRQTDQVRAVLNARWRLRHAERLGHRVRLWGKPWIEARGCLRIGDRVQLRSMVATLEMVVEEGAILEIGERSLVNFGCELVAHSRVTIGPRCLIGSHSILMDTPYHTVAPERRLDRPAPRPITLQENVWLGVRVIVMPGVTIGSDSVIGAGSIVTEDIDPGVLAVGSPARVVRRISS